MLVSGEKLLNYVGGELLAPSGGHFLESVNPATGQLHSLVPDSTLEDLELAVKAAQSAVAPWLAMGPDGRAEVLHKLADILDANLELLVRAEVEDNGMTYSFAKNVEVPRGAMNLRSFAQAALDFSRPQPFVAGHAQGYVLHQPVGVVGTISPWNLPLLSFTWKLAPALASGNCVVAKPSEVTPVTAFLLSKFALEAGFPPGVLNVLHGRGQTIGSAITAHPGIHRLSFTGSTATGRLIAATCAQHLKTSPSLEMGGKNPSIVFADASFAQAVEGVMRAAFSNQGQICLCGSRIYVERPIYEAFREALVEQTKAIKIGDPMLSDTEHGATVSRSHMNKVLEHIELARSEGGRVLCGGERQFVDGHCVEGFFVQPTLLEGLANRCRTNQEEIFGPVATLAPFDKEAEVIELANDSSYGLAATIWTQDYTKATRVADALQVGMPWINCWNLRVLETPFGGFKDSGNGHREGVPDAMVFFTEKKTVTTRLRENE